MQYNRVCRAKFFRRNNRFVGEVLLDGERIAVHIKNTGRCAELLVEGATVYLEKSENPHRKYAYDLIAVEKKIRGESACLINMDSQAPNAVVGEWLREGELFSKEALVRSEVFFERSRFDFYIEDGDRRAFLEVKGVTLERDGIAMFPDAPTERGERHLQELCLAVEHGYEAYAVFVIQMKGCTRFVPNAGTDPRFAKALCKAKNSGVSLLALDCMVLPDSLSIDGKIPISLSAADEVSPPSE